MLKSTNSTDCFAIRSQPILCFERRSTLMLSLISCFLSNRWLLSLGWSSCLDEMQTTIVFLNLSLFLSLFLLSLNSRLMVCVLLSESFPRVTSLKWLSHHHHYQVALPCRSNKISFRHLHVSLQSSWSALVHLPYVWLLRIIGAISSWMMVFSTDDGGGVACIFRICLRCSLHRRHMVTMHVAHTSRPPLSLHAHNPTSHLGDSRPWLLNSSRPKSLTRIAICGRRAR